MRFIDLTGQRFGRLAVIKRAGYKRERITWLCRCDCGTETVITGHELKCGGTKSCGCLKVDTGKTINLIHGMSYTRLHRTWDGMKARCFNSNHHKYKDYGGRGITVCDEWRNSFEAFRDWAISNGYSETLTIDRIDVDGNYCPENCRWATAEVQMNNMRTNKLLTFNGETHTQEQWARIRGFKDGRIIHKRLSRGWSIERALTEPARQW